MVFKIILAQTELASEREISEKDFFEKLAETDIGERFHLMFHIPSVENDLKYLTGLMGNPRGVLYEINHYKPGYDAFIDAHNVYGHAWFKQPYKQQRMLITTPDLYLDLQKSFDKIKLPYRLKS